MKNKLRPVREKKNYRPIPSSIHDLSDTQTQNLNAVLITNIFYVTPKKFVVPNLASKIEIFLICL